MLRNAKGFTLIELIIVVAIIGILGVWMLAASNPDGSGMTDPGGARNLLSKAYSFDQIEIGPYEPTYCHEDDVTATAFKAKNSKGEHVQGVVCGGYNGEKTVRFID